MDSRKLLPTCVPINWSIRSSALSILSSLSAVRYDGHAVYQIKLVNRAQAEAFTKFFVALEESHSFQDRSSINNDQLVLDIFPDYQISVGENYIRVNNKQLFESYLKEMQVEYRVVVENIQTLIDRERMELVSH